MILENSIDIFFNMPMQSFTKFILKNFLYLFLPVLIKIDQIFLISILFLIEVTLWQKPITNIFDIFEVMVSPGDFFVEIGSFEVLEYVLVFLLDGCFAISRAIGFLPWHFND